MASVGWIDWLREGGWGAFAALLFGIPAIALAIVHAALAQRWSLAVGGGLLAVVLLAGAGGTLAGRRMTEQAIAAVSPEVQDEIRAVGYEEASHPIKLAGILVGIGLVPLVIGEARRRGRPG